LKNMIGAEQTDMTDGVVGFVNFINTAPIYVPWQEMGPLRGWTVREGPPTLLNRWLEEGLLDVGLVSSFAYGMRAGDYYIFPDLGISATGPVGSVTLFSRSSTAELDGETVLLTTQSATSVNLLRIILEKFWGVKPNYRTGKFEETGDGVQDPKAYLAIGDEALRLRAVRTDLLQIDLAEVWLEQTGYPFVFAVWAIRRGSWERDPQGIHRLHERLLRCYRRGKDELERISRLAAPRVPLTPSECLAYLQGIELNLSMEKQQGLLHFFDLLHRHGVLPAVPELAMVPLGADSGLSATTGQP